MSPANKEKVTDINEPADDSANDGVSSERRAALTKIAYGSPAVAALLLSKNAAAQASAPAPSPFTPPPPPN